MAYEDSLQGAEYVEALRERLVLLRELLSSSGSIYLHLDENMIFHIKLIMDEVFGGENYRNLIVRKKCNPKNYTKKAYGNVADFILFYTKGRKYVWNRPLEALSEKNLKEYRYVEPHTGRRHMRVPIHAPGKRRGATGGAWRGRMPPPGKHWQYTPETLDKMDARGEIYWSSNGNPRRKVYIDQHPGAHVQDIWLDYKDAHNQNIRISGYPTEKNPDLLRRIVRTSSNPGDLVLDCYAGSGTTLAVAQELDRQWVGMDSSVEAVSTMLERFELGLSPMGDYVTKQGEKEAGGGRQVSLFDSLEEAVEGDARRGKCEAANVRRSDFAIYVERERSDAFLPIVKSGVGGEMLRPKGDSAIPPRVASGANYADICYELKTRDSRLAPVLEKVGDCMLRPRPAGFSFLVDAIVRQQLSKRAADSIVRRLRSEFPNSQATARGFRSVPQSRIVGTGVSARKYRAMWDLAGLIEDGSINLVRILEESDESIRSQLKQVKGIGDWTVDMYLIFGLGRLDVFPVRDLLLRKQVGALYDVDVSDVSAMRAIADRWRPYRSVASWYLYRSAEV